MEGDDLGLIVILFDFNEKPRFLNLFFLFCFAGSEAVRFVSALGFVPVPGSVPFGFLHALDFVHHFLLVDLRTRFLPLGFFIPVRDSTCSHF
jgi:hypothetical protein